MRIKQGLGLVLGMALAVPVMARDACVVGQWEPIGNGVRDWMQQQAPAMQVSIRDQQAKIHLKADGHYATAAQAEVSAQQDELRAVTQQASYRAQGTWTADDGLLVLSPDAQNSDGKMEVSIPGGRRLRLPMPRGSMRATQLQYRCSETSLETRMSMPNSDVPVVQRYRRLAARE